MSGQTDIMFGMHDLKISELYCKILELDSFNYVLSYRIEKNMCRIGSPIWTWPYLLYIMQWKKTHPHRTHHCLIVSPVVHIRHCLNYIHDSRWFLHYVAKIDIFTLTYSSVSQHMKWKGVYYIMFTPYLEIPFPNNCTLNQI